MVLSKVICWAIIFLTTLLRPVPLRLFLFELIQALRLFSKVKFYKYWSWKTFILHKYQMLFWLRHYIEIKFYNYPIHHLVILCFPLFLVVYIFDPRSPVPVTIHCNALRNAYLSTAGFQPNMKGLTVRTNKCNITMARLFYMNTKQVWKLYYYEQPFFFFFSNWNINSWCTTDIESNV